MSCFFKNSICLMLLWSFTVQAVVYEIFTMQELVEALTVANEQDWVVFDVDEVIIVSKDQAFRAAVTPHTSQLAIQELAKANEEEKDFLEDTFSLAYLHTESQLIEPQFPKILKDLQARGIYTLAETHCDSGKFGLVPSLQAWRINHLKSFGVDFSIDQAAFCMDAIKRAGVNAPVYDSGILFCKGYPKGEVLSHFISLQTTPPRKVYFVDDLEKNVLSVQQSLDQAGIACDTFVYSGATAYDKPLDMDTILYQFHYLIENRVWLSDEKVQAMRQVTHE